MRDLVIALEAAPESLHATVFDRGLEPVHSGSAEVPMLRPEPGWAEADPARLWEAARALLRAALAAAGKNRVAALGLTGPGGTAALWDRRTSKPLYNLIAGPCRRAAGLCERLLADGAEPEVRRRTGLWLRPQAPAAKIRWMLEASPDAQAAWTARTCAFGSAQSWALWMLTGGQCHAVDHAGASETLLYDLDGGEWSDAMCELLQVPRPVLPELKSCMGEFGLVSPSLFGEEFPVAAMLPAPQAALFALCGSNPESAALLLGPEPALSAASGLRAPRDERLASLVAWRRGLMAEYCVEAPLPSGDALPWLVEGLDAAASPEALEPLAASVQDSGGVLLVPPAPEGARGPVPPAAGTVFGVSRSTTAGRLARAAMEASAFLARDARQAVESATGRPLRRVHALGPLAGLDTLLQAHADVLGSAVERAAPARPAAAGAALMAGLAAGLWPAREAVVNARPSGRVFLPQWAEDRREEAYSIWRAAAWGPGGPAAGPGAGKPTEAAHA